MVLKVYQRGKMLCKLWDLLNQQKFQIDFLLGILEKDEIINLIEEIKVIHHKNQLNKYSSHFKLSMHCSCKLKLSKLNNLLILIELNNIMNNLSDFDHSFI